MKSGGVLRDGGEAKFDKAGRAAVRPGRGCMTGGAYYAEFLRLRWMYECRRHGGCSNRRRDDARLSFDFWYEEKEGGLAGRFDHLGFAEWLVARRASLAPGSWRRTRAAALEGLGIEGSASARQAEQLLNATPASGAPRTNGSVPVKLRNVGGGELGRVLAALDRRARRGSRVAHVAAVWLRAGRGVALPPRGWRGARVLPEGGAGGPRLVVPERVPGSGGGADRFRAFDLAALTPGDLAAVRALADAVGNLPETAFVRLRRSCTELLSRVSAEIWRGDREARRSLTLHSTRRSRGATATAVEVGGRVHARLDGERPPASR